MLYKCCTLYTYPPVEHESSIWGHPCRLLIHAKMIFLICINLIVCVLFTYTWKKSYYYSLEDIFFDIRIFEIFKRAILVKTFFFHKNFCFANLGKGFDDFGEAILIKKRFRIQLGHPGSLYYTASTYFECVHFFFTYLMYKSLRFDC